MISTLLGSFSTIPGPRWTIMGECMEETPSPGNHSLCSAKLMLDATKQCLLCFYDQSIYKQLVLGNDTYYIGKYEPYTKNDVYYFKQVDSNPSAKSCLYFHHFGAKSSISVA